MLTTAGSSCGVIPTAIASENSSDSMSGRPSSRLATKISGRQHERDLEQEQGEPAEPALELGLRLLRRPRPDGDASELGVGPVATTTPIPLPA